MKKLILFICCTLDGYIAKPGDDLSFLERVQIKGEDYGYNEFTDSIDTVIVGRRTYDWVIAQGYEFPHKDKDIYIITSKDINLRKGMQVFNGNLDYLIGNLKLTEGKNIFCDGGASITNQLLKSKLFDELIVSVVPILLGQGIRLFDDGSPEQNLELISSKQYKSGLVQLHYVISRPSKIHS